MYSYRRSYDNRSSWMEAQHYFVLGIVAYIVSLLVPAMVFSKASLVEVKTGSELLFWGWAAILNGVPAWIANITLALGSIFFVFKAYSWAMPLIILSVILALSSLVLFWVAIPVKALSGADMTLQAPHLGFFCWVASMVFIGYSVWMKGYEDV